MFFMFFIFCLFLYFFYSYYNILLLLLLLEFFALFSYFLISIQLSLSGLFFGFLIIFSCYMVMEAILGLSCLLASSRLTGKSYFYLW